MGVKNEALAPYGPYYPSNILFLQERKIARVSSQKYFYGIRIRRVDNYSERLDVFRKIRMGLIKERSLCKERWKQPDFITYESL
jgi:hypothetical protein